jgi:hypothetical protein
MAQDRAEAAEKAHKNSLNPLVLLAFQGELR